jgi:hypothetical protein
MFDAQRRRRPQRLAVFGSDESSVRLCQKHKAEISEFEASLKKFTGPKKRQFSEIDGAVFMFLSRYARLE